MLKDIYFEHFSTPHYFPHFIMTENTFSWVDIHYHFSFTYSITSYIFNQHVFVNWMFFLFGSKIDLFWKYSYYEQGFLNIYMNMSSFWIHFQVFFVATRRRIKEKCCHKRTSIWNIYGCPTGTNHKSCRLDIFQIKKTFQKM